MFYHCEGFTRKFLAVIFLFWQFFLAYSQPSKAMELSDNLFSILAESDFLPQKNYLSGVNRNQFPYSITVYFPAKERSDDKPSLILSVPQEMAAQMAEDLLPLLKKLQASSLSVNMTVLFVADDFSRIPARYGGNIPYGTQSFLSNIDVVDDTAAILVAPHTFTDKNKYSVVFGTDGLMTPQWFLSQIPLEISQNSLLTYRLNLSDSDHRLAAFLEKGIAAVTVQMDGENKEQTRTICNAIEQISCNLTKKQSQHSESGNYLFLSMPNSKKIWIVERLFIVIYIIAAACALFFLSGFSLFKKNKIERQKEFSRTWYLIPTTIIISTLSLQVGQFLAIKIHKFVDFTDLSVTIISFKTFFSFLIVSVVLTILAHLNLPLSQVVYGFLITLVSALNIFIFSSIDLVLLMVFTFEYMIIYFARFSKRTVPLFVSILLMLVPFVPYAINIWEFAAPEKLVGLVRTDFTGNMLYACILMPFQIMWLRIFVRMNVFGKNKNMSTLKIHITSGILLFAMLCVMAGGLAAITKIFSRTKPFNEETSEVSFYAPPLLITTDDTAKAAQVEVKADRSEYLETGFVNIVIKSTVPLLKYDVVVESNTNNPVYDSYAPYETVQKNGTTWAIFSLPYNPSFESNLFYSSNIHDKQKVYVRMFVQKDENTATIVEKTLEIPPVEEGN